MRIKVQLVVEDDAGDSTLIQEIAELQRDGLSPANLGLTLTDAKEILQTLQNHVVKQQVTEYQQQQLPCPYCQQILRA